MKSTLTTMTVSLTAIAIAVGAALSLVHDLTAEPIARQQEAIRNQALEAVMPLPDGARFGDPAEIYVDGDSRCVTLYPAVSADGRLLGAAIETWTLDGFSGEILVMAGIDAEGRITGYEILQSSETPGLGDKAAYWFKAESDAGAVDANSGASARHGRSIIGSAKRLKVAKDDGTIDGITAATITSRAFLGAINRARAAWESYLDTNQH